MPINIKEIELQNFRSYGNYKTKLNLDNLGPVLIVGEIETEDGVSRSCGSGKSSLIQAIIWAIFGRTYEDARPGDKVINFVAQKDCYVKLTTTDGYTIIRNRKVNGKNDLLFYKDDLTDSASTNENAQKEIIKTFSLNFDTFSSAVFFEQRAKPLLDLKPKERQIILEQMLNLHKINYRADIAKEHLKEEENEQKTLLREKEVYERDVEKIEVEIVEANKARSDFEQSRLDKVIETDNKISSLKKEIASIKLPDIEDLKAKYDLINKVEGKKSTLSSERSTADLELHKTKSDISTYRSSIGELSNSLKNREDIDIDNLERLWDKYGKMLSEISSKKNNLEELEKILWKLESKIKDLNSNIKEWHDKSGTTCPTCKQEVSEEHANHLIDPYQKELEQYVSKKRKAITAKELLESKIKEAEIEAEKEKPDMNLDYAKEIIKDKNDLEIRIKELHKKIEVSIDKEKELISTIKKLEDVLIKIELSLSSNKPSISLSEAEMMHSNHNRVGKQLEDLEFSKNEIKVEENPHTKSLKRLENFLNDTKSKLKIAKDNIKRKDILIKHYDYIRKAYYDKKKIKSLLLNEMVPTLNDRLRYYLDQFGFDVIDIKFNNLLQVESDKWDSKLCSGGERQAIDLALILALYDLNSLRFGRQCNIMVLDEVDSRLDSYYVNAFSSLVIDDFGKQGSNKPSTIMVVSHKDDMTDAFPTKIRVTNKKGFSYAEVEA